MLTYRPVCIPGLGIEFFFASPPILVCSTLLVSATSCLPKVMCAFPDLNTCHLGRVCYTQLQGLREDANKASHYLNYDKNKKFTKIKSSGVS